MTRRSTLGLALLAACSWTLAGPASSQTVQPAAPAAPAAPAPAAAPAARPSPMAMAKINLGDAYLRVVYSRPSKRGRDNIFGTKESKALVPFGEIWRTGANEATELTVTRDVTIGGKRLAAGTYSLFTTPGPDRWTIHVNSALGLWGSTDYAAAKDVLAVTVTPTALTEEVEQFTIAFEPKGDAADLVLRWIKTEVRVPVQLAK